MVGRHSGHIRFAHFCLETNRKVVDLNGNGYIGNPKRVEIYVTDTQT
jgi:hypothetical protein